MPKEPLMKLAPIIRPVVASLVTGACLMTLPSAAEADPHPAHTGVVSADPANQTPNVLDGHVNAFAQVGDTMIAGGDFSEVEQDGTTYQRDNVFAFSVSTGEIVEGFTPSVDREVFDLQLTADQQRVLLAGEFSSVGGAPRTAKVAMVNIADGTVAPAFTSPMPNGIVRDVVAANGYYYIAGAFTSLGGHPRSYLAALNSDGSDSGTAALAIAGTNAGGATSIRSMDISPDGSRLVIAGNFASIGGSPRGQLAVLDTTAAATTLSSWATQRFAQQCGPHFDSYMRDVAFAPSGSYFVVVTTGGPLGFQKSGLLCDTATRWDISADPHAQPTWTAYTGGDTLTAAIVDANAVYIGGHQRWLNNSYGHNNAKGGAVSREGIAALDPANGLPYTWNPGRRRGYGVYGFALTSDGLWVGSDTTGFGGELRNRIAFCPLVGGFELPPYLTGSLPGHLALLDRPGVIRVRAFDGEDAEAESTISSGRWARVRGAFVVDATLYAAWADGSLTAQSFDGESVGPRTQVDLHGGFSDAGDIDAMFFDRATHRLYYTLEGRNRLYYRYFQPQSQIVGAWRYTATAGGALDWRTVENAFLIGHRLFYANGGNGTLRRVKWSPATAQVTTGPTTVLGPAIDGTDYRTAGLVALP
jgi:hypothetical protein